ncbi:MAG: hypothetical protein AB7G06_06735 [Bdellovibrionales bacterium]
MGASTYLDLNVLDLVNRVAKATGVTMSATKPEDRVFQKLEAVSFRTDAFRMCVEKDFSSDSRDGVALTNTISLFIKTPATVAELRALNIPSFSGIEYGEIHFCLPENEGDSLKARLAIELARSGVPELEELGRDFAAELKGEKPTPPVAKDIRQKFGMAVNPR